MIDDCGMANGSESAADFLGHFGMEIGEPFDMGLIDECVMPRCVGPSVVTPVERRVDHHAFWHGPGIVFYARGHISLARARHKAEKRIIVADPSGKGLGV